MKTFMSNQMGEPDHHKDMKIHAIVDRRGASARRRR